MYYRGGSKCFNYGKNFSANVTIECGGREGFSFKEKVNGCHYECVYTTKIGCNMCKIDSIKYRIKLFLKEINF